MAHIPMDRINSKVIEADGDSTVADVAQVYEHLPEVKRHHWYVIVQLGNDRFATLAFKDLLDATEEFGPAIRDRPLRDFPGLRDSKVIERQGQGYGEARRVRNRSYKRRLVVLESGKPIGLLIETTRSGGFGGFMSTLFGQADRPINSDAQLQIRCPDDGQMYNFADIIDLETDKLVCPQGHIIEE